MIWKKILTEEDKPFLMSCGEDKNEYDGVVWQFTKVSIRNTILGNCRIKFNYEIKDDPLMNTDFKTEGEKKAFELYIGDVLIQLITETNENSNNNTEKSSQPGRLREEGSPSSEG